MLLSTVYTIDYRFSYLLFFNSEVFCRFCQIKVLLDFALACVFFAGAHMFEYTHTGHAYWYSLNKKNQYTYFYNEAAVTGLRVNFMS